jgi:hypothetical protein
MSTNDEFTYTTGPLVDEFASDVAERKSAHKAIGQWAAEGRLGDLAKELGELADIVAKSGYVPARRRADAEKYQELAKSVTDRELARYYRDKAKQAATQMGEQK